MRHGQLVPRRCGQVHARRANPRFRKPSGDPCNGPANLRQAARWSAISGARLALAIVEPKFRAVRVHDRCGDRRSKNSGPLPAGHCNTFQRMTCRARCSLISRCRGTGWETPVRGFRYQSCRPPWRTKTHPNPSIARTRSTRFTGPPAHRPYGCQLAHCWSGPGRGRRSDSSDPTGSRPESSNRDNRTVRTRAWSNV
jgi:hypothetical protein